MKHSVFDYFRLAGIFLHAVFCRKTSYSLEFMRTGDDKWYAVIPNWPESFFKNTEMVFGANRLLTKISSFYDSYVMLKVSTQPLDRNDIILHRKAWRLFGGAVYDASQGYIYDTLGMRRFTEDIWICPVTLFVMGHYPKTIYVRVEDTEVPL